MKLLIETETARYFILPFFLSKYCIYENFHITLHHQTTRKGNSSTEQIKKWLTWMEQHRQ